MLRKKGIVFVLVLALAIMAFAPAVMAYDMDNITDSFPPGFYGEVFISSDGNDFLVLGHDTYCELVGNGVIPGEASGLYGNDYRPILSVRPNGAYHYIKPEYFPAFKLIVFGAVDWLN